MLSWRILRVRIRDGPTEEFLCNDFISKPEKRVAHLFDLVVIPSCDGGNFARTSIPFPDDWSLEDQA